MDLADEELKQPLVPAIETQNVPGNSATSTPSRSPQSVGTRPSPKRKGTTHPFAHGNAPTGAHYVALRNGNGTSEDEEKHAESSSDKEHLPYAAPNVHPYAVPQYEPSAYGGRGGNAWGDPENGLDQSRLPTIDIVFSGMYTLAAALTIIQGFGMLIHFTVAAMILGAYTMAFGCAVIMHDLNAVVHGVSVEQYFPFLGNYLGRALTIFFFAALCGQTYDYSGWTRLIVNYNLLVAGLQGFVYFTTKTVTPTVNPHMEDLPDL